MENVIPKFTDEHVTSLVMRVRLRHIDGGKTAKKIESFKSLDEKVKFIEKNDLLKQLLIDIVKRCKFKLDKLSMQSNGFWTMKLIIQEQIPKVHRNYQLIFTVDLDGVDRQIIDIKKAIAHEENDQQLLPDIQVADIAEMKKQKKRFEDQRKMLTKTYQDIVFSASVKELKYKDSNTDVLFDIPADIIDVFNEHRYAMDNY